MIYKIYTFQYEANKFLYGLGKGHQQCTNNNNNFDLCLGMLNRWQMVCKHFDLSREILRNYAAIVGYRLCKNLYKYPDYPKILSYPMEMWQKMFIPYENIAKYFGTPLFNH